MRARREYAANAILEDERLRGDLTDDQFGQLQADALKEVDQAALATKGLDEDAARKALDEAVQRAKERVRERATPPAQPTIVGRLLSHLRLQP
jgi:hypothetical protein